MCPSIKMSRSCGWSGTSRGVAQDRRRVWHPAGMRTITAVSIAALLALMAGAASGAGQARPILLLVGDSSLHGMHFRAMERVHVVVVNRNGASKWARTSQRGAFRMTADLPDPCRGTLVVRAIGATGDTATLKVPQRECPPPLRPGSG